VIPALLSGLALYAVISLSFCAGVLACAFFVGATRGDDAVSPICCERDGIGQCEPVSGRALYWK
jgi:hypothetical protein